jgi:hydroxymethylpyrimidine/phosphomethylpyrimidine kinase
MAMTRTPPIILTIAGFDPSSGAGITADLKTAAAHGCYATACITALTVQSTRGVSRVEALRPSLVRDTLEELVADMAISAVKIGMLGSAEVAREVADFLDEAHFGIVVLDTIVRSSSGADLLGSGGLEIMRDRLVPLSTVVTPNVDEAAALTGMRVSSVPEMRTAAERLRQLGATNVVVTGGHLAEPVDLLSSPTGVEEFRGAHLDSYCTHGTGCAFSTALACNLVNCKALGDAVSAAKAYVTAAIRAGYPVGSGGGPVNHLFAWADPAAKS